MNNYLKWLDSPLITNEEKEILRDYSEEEKESYFQDDPLKFGTAGIRAKMGLGTNLLNKFTYRQLAHGYAKFLLEKSNSLHIIIAHDNRKNGKEFAQECARVMTSFGIKVSYFDNNELLATPIVSFLIRKLSLDGGIIITASHNPKEYNGFKVYNSTGCQVSDDEASSIMSFFPSNDSILLNTYAYDEQLVSYLDKNILEDYYKAAKDALIKTDVNEIKDFPIVFTANCGTSSYIMGDFLKTLGYTNLCKVEEQCIPDEDFINSPCANPEDPKSFDLAIKLANEKEAKIVLGVDPDSDRLAVVVKDSNNEWRYLTGNEVGCLCAYYVLKNKSFDRPKFLVTTYISTSLIDRIAKDFDVEVLKTSTGFKWLANLVEQNYKDKDFVIAFEEAIGSLNSTINRDKDGFQASALVLEIFNDALKNNMTIIDILENEIYPEYGYWVGKTVSYWIDGLNWREQANKIMDYFRDFNEPLFDDVELISNTWHEEGKFLDLQFQKDISIKVRVSGTEPKYKFYIDAYSNSIEESKALLESIINKIDEIVKHIN